jgi:large subunit ribosomal protein L15
MITINTLVQTVQTGKKRLGQGHGSGRGKTGGRGTKGQKARGTIPVQVAQGGSFFLKRLPLYRGKLRNKGFSGKRMPVNLKFLNVLSKGTVVDLATLIDQGIVDKNSVGSRGVKILGDGDLNVALTVKLPCSKHAVKKIEKAGGTVVA